MHVEFSGGIQPVFHLPGRGAALPAAGSPSRRIPERPRPPIAEPAPSAPVKAESVRRRPAGSTYWADFLGPGRLGHYDQKPILTAWPAGGLPQVWKQPVGGGYASFTAANGLAFTIEQRRGNEVVAAYDVRTGRERWTHSWKALFEESWAATDRAPRRCGTMGASTRWAPRANCAAWKRPPASWSGTRTFWPTTARPTSTGACRHRRWWSDGKVIVTPGGGHGNSVVAYDKLTGKRVWGSLDDKAAYASPTVATVGGRRQLLVMTAKRAVGLTVEDGKLLWEYPWVTEKDINAAQPIAVAANRVYLSSGYGHGATVLELTPQGDGFQTRVVWANTRMKNKFNSAVLYEGYLYGLDEEILACVDVETGELKWKGGRYGYGQLLLASRPPGGADRRRRRGAGARHAGETPGSGPLQRAERQDVEYPRHQRRRAAGAQ
jgi:outer membrane protein assembly factor BamB